MTAAGIRLHVYDPKPRLFGMRTNVFRRLHRKIVVVDGKLAFVGGLNFSADHLGDFGPAAKQDYAVQIQGPLVDEIERFATQALTPTRGRFLWGRLRGGARPESPRPSEAVAALVVRDNEHHKSDIELHYRIGIRAAQHDITIANAYFFPGYRFLRDLRRAAKRGVDVRLILQGEPDMVFARFASTMLYDYLLSAGVRIYEYCERPLHGKVACVDDVWSTVGSSNLDPLSLALNLEANVMIRDREFSSFLRARLDRLVVEHCREMRRESPPRRKIQRVLLGTLVFHILQRFPSWAGWLPARKPHLTSFPSGAGDSFEGKT
jgi:cardiolipin synthase